MGQRHRDTAPLPPRAGAAARLVGLSRRGRGNQHLATKSDVYHVTIVVVTANALINGGFIALATLLTRGS